MSYLNFYKPSGGDPYFGNVILLLKMEGADAGTTFTDLSSYARPITNTSSIVTTRTAQKKFGSSSALFAPASGDLTAANGSLANSQLPGDFTIECFAYWPANPASNTGLVSLRSATSSEDIEIYRRPASGHKLVLFQTGSGNVIIGTTTITNAVWHHCCLERVGTTVTLALDGVSQGTYTTSDTFGSTTSNRDHIGSYDFTQEIMDGYIDNVRITRGLARYGSYPFTPPAVDFPSF